MCEECGKEHIPNKLTKETLEKSERGEDIQMFENVEELFDELMIEDHHSQEEVWDKEWGGLLEGVDSEEELTKYELRQRQKQIDHDNEVGYED